MNDRIVAQLLVVKKDADGKQVVTGMLHGDVDLLIKIGKVLNESGIRAWVDELTVTALTDHPMGDVVTRIKGM